MKPNINAIENYNQIVNQLRENYKQYTDKDFPPKINSIFTSNLDVRNFNKSISFVRICRSSKLKNSSLLQAFENPYSLRPRLLKHQNFTDALRFLMMNAPNLLEKIFITKEVNDIGFYCLFLYVNGKATPVFLDDYIPVYKPSHERSSDIVPGFAEYEYNELWPILIEKAYAKMLGSYEAIASRTMDEILQDLVGLPCSCKIYKKPEDLWEMLVNVIDTKKVVLASFKPLKNGDENDLFIIKKLEDRPYKKVFLKNIRYNIEQWLEIGQLYDSAEVFFQITLEADFWLSTVKLSRQNFKKPFPIKIELKEDSLVMFRILQHHCGVLLEDGTQSDQNVNTTGNEDETMPANVRILLCKSDDEKKTAVFTNGEYLTSSKMVIEAYLQAGNYFAVVEISPPETSALSCDIGVWAFAKMNLATYYKFDLEGFQNCIIKDLVESNYNQIDYQVVQDFKDIGVEDIFRVIGSGLGMIWYFYRNHSPVDVLIEKCEFKTKNLILEESAFYQIEEIKQTDDPHENIYKIKFSVFPNSDLFLLFKILRKDFSCQHNFDTAVEEINSSDQSTPKDNNYLTYTFQEDITFGNMKHLDKNNIHDKVFMGTFLSPSPRKPLGRSGGDRAQSDPQINVQTSEFSVPTKPNQPQAALKKIINSDRKPPKAGGASLFKKEMTLSLPSQILPKSKQNANVMGYLLESLFSKYLEKQARTSLHNLHENSCTCVQKFGARKINQHLSDLLYDRLSFGLSQLSKNPFYQTSQRVRPDPEEMNFADIVFSLANIESPNVDIDDLPYTSNEVWRAAEVKRRLCWLPGTLKGAEKALKIEMMTKLKQNAPEVSAFLSNRSGGGHSGRGIAALFSNRSPQARSVKSRFQRMFNKRPGTSSDSRYKRDADSEFSSPDRYYQHSHAGDETPDQQKLSKLNKLLNKRIMGHKRVENYLQSEHSIFQIVRILQGIQRKHLMDCFEQIQYWYSTRNRAKTLLRHILLLGNQRWQGLLKTAFYKWARSGNASFVDLKTKYLINLVSQGFIRQQSTAFQRIKSSLQISIEDDPQATLFKSLENIFQQKAKQNKQSFMQNLKRSLSNSNKFPGQQLIHALNKIAYGPSFVSLRANLKHYYKLKILLAALQSPFKKSTQQAFSKIEKSLLSQSSQSFKTIQVNRLARFLIKKLENHKVDAIISLQEYCQHQLTKAEKQNLNAGKLLKALKNHQLMMAKLSFKLIKRHSEDRYSAITTIYDVCETILARKKMQVLTYLKYNSEMAEEFDEMGYPLRQPVFSPSHVKRHVELIEAMHEKHYAARLLTKTLSNRTRADAGDAFRSILQHGKMNSYQWTVIALMFSQKLDALSKSRWKNNLGYAFQRIKDVGLPMKKERMGSFRNLVMKKVTPEARIFGMAMKHFYEKQCLKLLKQGFHSIIIHQHKEAFDVQHKLLRIHSLLEKCYQQKISKAFNIWKTDLQVCQAEFYISKRLLNIKRREKDKYIQEILDAIRETDDEEHEDVLKFITPGAGGETQNDVSINVQKSPQERVPITIHIPTGSSAQAQVGSRTSLNQSHLTRSHQDLGNRPNTARNQHSKYLQVSDAMRSPMVKSERKDYSDRRAILEENKDDGDYLDRIHKYDQDQLRGSSALNRSTGGPRMHFYDVQVLNENEGYSQSPKSFKRIEQAEGSKSPGRTSPIRQFLDQEVQEGKQRLQHLSKADKHETSIRPASGI